MKALPFAAVMVGAAMVGAAIAQSEPSWLAAFHEAVNREANGRVRLVYLPPPRPWRTAPRNDPLFVLRTPELRGKVYAPGCLGYTVLASVRQPVVIFVHTDRVQPALLPLVTAHELGHALLQTRGYRELIAFTADPDVHAVLQSCMNVVADHLIDGELRRRGIASDALYRTQLLSLLAELRRSAYGGFAGREIVKRTSLAELVARLLLDLGGMPREKARLQAAIPASVRELALGWVQILRSRVETPAQYEDAVRRVAKAADVDAVIRFARD